MQTNSSSGSIYNDNQSSGNLMFGTQAVKTPSNSYGQYLYKIEKVFCFVTIIYLKVDLFLRKIFLQI